MTNILFNVNYAAVGLTTHENDLDFEQGRIEEGTYALTVGDDSDTVALVGTLDELDELLVRFRAEVAKLRRYDKALERAKARLLE